MTIRAGLILPRVAPIRASTNDAQCRVSDRGFTRGSCNQGSAVITGAKLAQSKLSGRKVIDTSLQVGQLATDQIELNLVKRSRACRRAKIELAPRIFSFARDPRGQIQQLGD